MHCARFVLYDYIAVKDKEGAMKRRSLQVRYRSEEMEEIMSRALQGAIVTVQEGLRNAPKYSETHEDYCEAERTLVALQNLHEKGVDDE